MPRRRPSRAWFAEKKRREGGQGHSFTTTAVKSFIATLDVETNEMTECEGITAVFYVNAVRDPSRSFLREDGSFREGRAFVCSGETCSHGKIHENKVKLNRAKE